MGPYFQKFSTAAERLIAGQAPFVAVAVSGGSDSLALALLLRDFLKQKNGRLLALTVDHGLRAESLSEAQAVAAQMQVLNISHQILRWEGVKPQSAISEQARQARYDLLLQAAKSAGCGYIATAHQAEDQAETFWMRLAGGSGLDGLCGIAESRTVGGLQLIRPVLSLSKDELREVCRAAGQSWIEDPTNQNAHFLRPRLRAFADALQDEGLTPQRLTATMKKLQSAAQALDQISQEFFNACVTGDAAGYLTLDVSRWKDSHSELRRRVLQKTLGVMNGPGYPVPDPQLQDLEQALLQKNFSGVTLAGIEMFSTGKGIIFCREYAAIAPPVMLKEKESVIWDRRFQATGDPGQQVGGLGTQDEKEFKSELAALPYKIRLTLPVLREDKKIVSVPYLNGSDAIKFLHSPYGGIV
jgi:tRNA(Ile)-lysidine synthase